MNASVVSVIAYDVMLVVAARIAEAGLWGTEVEQAEAARDYQQYCAALNAEAKAAFDSAIAQAALVLQG